jgi:nucleoside-diphosphate-sugar epimerase
MNKILLTGCSGYIGHTLVPLLRQKKFSVIGLDRKSYPNTFDSLDGFIHGDLRDETVLKQIPDDVDMVCHLAAAKDDWGLSDEEYFDDNVNATRKLLQMAGERRNIRNWVFFSTVGVLGSSAAALNESAPHAPQGAYGESKAEGEKLFSQFAQSEPSARITIIRPSVVFGPDNPPNTNVYRLIDSIHTNRFIMVGKGDAIKTTSYIENLVAATLFLIDRMREGVQTFIYVDEPTLSTASMVGQICGLLRKSPPKWSVPLGIAASLAHVADIAAAVTRTDLPITSARIKKFCRPTNFDATSLRNLGFKQPVHMEEALRRTVHWYLSSRLPKSSLNVPVQTAGVSSHSDAPVI